MHTITPGCCVYEKDLVMTTEAFIHQFHRAYDWIVTSAEVNGHVLDWSTLTLEPKKYPFEHKDGPTTFDDGFRIRVNGIK